MPRWEWRAFGEAVAAAEERLADLSPPRVEESVELYVLCLPLLLAGLWSVFKLYGKLDDAAFRKVILLLLLVSGLALIVPASIFRSGA